VNREPSSQFPLPAFQLFIWLLFHFLLYPMIPLSRWAIDYRVKLLSIIEEVIKLAA